MEDKWNVVIDLREGGDWSLDLCFAGLNANGLDVLDVPYRDKHREWWDVINEKVKPDWGLERRTLGFGCTDDRKSFIPNSTELVSLKLLLQRKAVQRVWLDERAESFVKYCELGFRDAKVPVVVVAGHDRFWNFSPNYVGGVYGDLLEAMLLDNWQEEYGELPFPTKRIGWSCNFDHYWERPAEKPTKDIDICFVGYNSHPDRARFVNHIRKRWSHLNLHLLLEEEANSFDKFVPKSVLFQTMSRSKICLNLRGAADGGKTLRSYEIPYVGSYMLSQRIPDPGLEWDFEPGIHCGYFSGEDELDEQISAALENERWRETIARDGHERATTDLSVKSRWEDVLRWLKSEQ